MFRKRRTSEEEFVRSAESKVSFSSGLVSSTDAAAIRREIAEDMLDITRYADRLGMDVGVDSLPHVFVVSNNAEQIKGTSAAVYSNGVIFIKLMHSKDSSTLAHEFFHHLQHLNKNDDYNYTTQKSYIEAGAIFFEISYTGLSQYGVIPGAMNRRSFTEMLSRFERSSRTGRIGMLNDILENDNGESERSGMWPDGKYISGYNFASFVRLINGNNDKKTAQMFARMGLSDAVRSLSSAGGLRPLLRTA